MWNIKKQLWQVISKKETSLSVQTNKCGCHPTIVYTTHEELWIVFATSKELAESAASKERNWYNGQSGYDAKSNHWVRWLEVIKVVDAG